MNSGLADSMIRLRSMHEELMHIPLSPNLGSGFYLKCLNDVCITLADKGNHLGHQTLSEIALAIEIAYKAGINRMD